MSHNPHDRERAYCGACHRFASDYFEEVVALGEGMYSELRVVDGQIVGLGRFALTWGILVGMSLDSPYERRYCYEAWGEAYVALATWDGLGHPSGPWLKCKGRMPDGRWVDDLGPGLRAG